MRMWTFGLTGEFSRSGMNAAPPSSRAFSLIGVKGTQTMNKHEVRYDLRSYAPTLLRSYAPTLLRLIAHTKYKPPQKAAKR